MPFGRPDIGREMDKNSSSVSYTARFQDVDSLSKETENPKMEEKNGPPSDHYVIAEERKHTLTSRQLDAEMQTQDTTDMQASVRMASHHLDSSALRSGLVIDIPGDNMEHGHMHVGKATQGSSIMTINKQMKSEMSGWTGIGNGNESSRGPQAAYAVLNELSERKDDSNS